MSGKNNPKLYTYHELYTETYMSSLTNQEDRQAYDKNVHKAIKQNNVEYLVDKDRQNMVENAQLYNEEKELSKIIVEIRKKYDVEKIKTAKLEKNIAFLEEEKQQLTISINKLQDQLNQTTNDHQAVQAKHRDFQESLENLEYMRDIRLNMGDRLKQDILHFKKKCFQDNIRLIRMKTIIKEFQQKDTSKKHMNSKCKLVLNTLQQTVKVREEERETHLKQVQTVLMRKFQNNQMKTNREHELESSMYKALTERLPQENSIVKKLNCELFLRKLLRRKMNKLMQEFKEAEDAFNSIKKETKIASATQFIEDFLSKQQRYGNLLNSIGKAEKKIEEEKEKFQDLSKQNQHLEFQSLQIHEGFDHLHLKGKKEDTHYKKLVFYNDLAIKCEELKIMLARWATRTVHALSTSQGKSVPLNSSSSLASLKSLALKGIKLMTESLNESAKEQQEPLSTERNTLNRSNTSQQKLNLRTFTQSALSKECSKKNFRVRTMTTHQQAAQQHDNEYDELSQYDFLRFNRKLAKKNNIKTQRPRIKTKPF